MTDITKESNFTNHLSDDDYRTEKWASINTESIKPYYEVSNKGRVRRIKKTPGSESIYVALEENSAGYIRAPLVNENGKQSKYLVHRLVANEFIPNPNNKETINHKNGIKKDNRDTNIEWATQSENTTHMWNLYPDSIQHGENTSGAVFTNEEAVRIYNSNDRVVELAKQYNVSVSAIYSIKSGRSYSVATGAERKLKKKVFIE